MSAFVPRRVKLEVQRYLECGELRYGFVEVTCEACTDARLVAFSCKGGGWCPSYTTRRAIETGHTLNFARLGSVPRRVGSDEERNYPKPVAEGPAEPVNNCLLHEPKGPSVEPTRPLTRRRPSWSKKMTPRPRLPVQEPESPLGGRKQTYGSEECVPQFCAYLGTTLHTRTGREKPALTYKVM